MPDPQNENHQDAAGGQEQQDLPGESEDLNEEGEEDEVTPGDAQEPDEGRDDDPTKEAPTE